MPKINRRQFFQQTSTIAVVCATSSITWAAEPKLTEDDPIALALGYREDASTVDAQKYPKRAGAEGAKQFCRNCTLYTEKADGYGGCTAIPGKLVAGNGWCNAWVPKG